MVSARAGGGECPHSPLAAPALTSLCAEPHPRAGELRRQAFLQLAQPVEEGREGAVPGAGEGPAGDADSVRAQLQRLRSDYKAVCTELRGEQGQRAALERRLQQLESGTTQAGSVEGEGGHAASKIVPQSIAPTCSLLHGAERSAAGSPGEDLSLSLEAPSSGNRSGGGKGGSGGSSALRSRAPAGRGDSVGAGASEAGAVDRRGFSGAAPDGAAARDRPVTVDAAEGAVGGGGSEGRSPTDTVGHGGGMGGGLARPPSASPPAEGGAP